MSIGSPALELAAPGAAAGSDVAMGGSEIVLLDLLDKGGDIGAQNRIHELAHLQEEERRHRFQTKPFTQLWECICVYLHK